MKAMEDEKNAIRAQERMQAHQFLAHQRQTKGFGLPHLQGGKDEFTKGVLQNSMNSAGRD